MQNNKPTKAASSYLHTISNIFSPGPNFLAVNFLFKSSDSKKQ